MRAKSTAVIFAASLIACSAPEAQLHDVKVADQPFVSGGTIDMQLSGGSYSIRLSAGDLETAVIAGDKDIESGAGNVQMSVGDPNDYASVDASVKVGNLEAGPFGESKSGLGQNFNWTGHGKYKLHVQLGAGNLELRSK